MIEEIKENNDFRLWNDNVKAQLVEYKDELKAAEHLYTRLAQETDIPPDMLKQAKEMQQLTKRNLDGFLKASRQYLSEIKAVEIAPVDF